MTATHMFTMGLPKTLLDVRFRYINNIFSGLYHNGQVNRMMKAYNICSEQLTPPFIYVISSVNTFCHVTETLWVTFIQHHLIY